jgi:hypothetical protein
MPTLRVDADNLIIDIHGFDKLWALKSRLTIPLAHVRGATAGPGVVNRPKGWRGPGAHIPRVIAVGTFHKDGDRVFWDVHDRNKAVIIELQDEKYRRIVVEVGDPQAAVKTIEQALAGR